MALDVIVLSGSLYLKFLIEKFKVNYIKRKKIMDANGYF